MADDQPVHIEGYALTHGDHERFGGPANKGWVERIDRGALERAVAERPTVPLRIGVDGPIIGQAQLTVDDTGLRVSADIEPSRTRQVGVEEGIPIVDRVHGPAPDAIKRGDPDLHAMYRVKDKDQQWSDDYNLREIAQLSVEEVSISQRPGQDKS